MAIVGDKCNQRTFFRGLPDLISIRVLESPEGDRIIALLFRKDALRNETL